MLVQEGNENYEYPYIIHTIPKQPCLIEEFFKEEEKKPYHIRSRTCMIKCPCEKCNPPKY